MEINEEILLNIHKYKPGTTIKCVPDYSTGNIKFNEEAIIAEPFQWKIYNEDLLVKVFIKGLEDKPIWRTIYSKEHYSIIKLDIDNKNNSSFFYNTDKRWAEII